MNVVIFKRPDFTTPYVNLEDVNMIEELAAHTVFYHGCDATEIQKDGFRWFAYNVENGESNE